MIELPDFTKQFEYENNFYLSCDHTRLSKFIAHYKLFQMITKLDATIVECGVFKGLSFLNFAFFREFFGNVDSHKLVGFDTFGLFPKTDFHPDKKSRNDFVQVAGEYSISKEQLRQVLKRKRVNKNVELIKGDIIKTVPEFVKKNLSLKIALLHVDVDIYEPTVIILKELYPRILKGGVCILDNYEVFPGETKAVNDYFKNKDVKILRFPFRKGPCYILKKNS